MIRDEGLFYLFFTLNLSASGYKMKQTAAMVTEQIWMLLNDVGLVCF